MKIEELEPEMEKLFHILIPDYMNWQGATKSQIDKIEQIVRKISGHGLPKFYRWFLMRMGRSMGNFSYPDLDHSASTVISWYEKEWEDDGSKFFRIGESSDEMELHMYYDLNYPARDDARVVTRHPEGGDDFKYSETFRELLASDAAQINALSCPENCVGVLGDEEGEDILPQIDPVLDSLGLKKLIFPTGSRVGIYKSDEATMLISTSLDSDTSSGGLTLGGRDGNILRKILGTIEADTGFDLDIEDDPRRIQDS